MYFSLTLLFSYHDSLIAVYQHNPHGRELGAGWSSPVARQAHNLKVAGSNPAPATKYSKNSTVSSLASLRVCGAFLRFRPIP